MDDDKRCQDYLTLKRVDLHKNYEVILFESLAFEWRIGTLFYILSTCCQFHTCPCKISVNINFQCKELFYITKHLVTINEYFMSFSEQNFCLDVFDLIERRKQYFAVAVDLVWHLYDIPQCLYEYGEEFSLLLTIICAILLMFIHKCLLLGILNFMLEVEFAELIISNEVK